MSPRLIIAAQSGVVIGLLGLTLYQARQLRAAHRELGQVAAAPLEFPTNASQRQLRLRLRQLPPINLPTRVEQLDWRSLESEDYPTYVANLRAAGCPEETLRDIIVADVNKLYSQRRRALAPPPADWDFWRPSGETEPDLASDAARAREAAEATLEAERRQLLATLLGPGAARAELAEITTDALADRSIQFLPEGKREAVAHAEARRRQALSDLDAMPTQPDAHAAQTQAIEQAYQDALTAALTPEEREQYEMRAGALGIALREQLSGFGASREEFETLYRLESDHARQLEQLEAARQAGTDPQAAEKLEAAQIEFQQSLETSLGPQRYAEYQRTQDQDFQTLYSLTREHQLPPALASEVWDMRATVEQQTDRIRDNPFLTAEQKIRAFQAIRNETQAAIVDVLGEPLLQEYRRQGGAWLQELTDIRNLGETDLEIVPPPLPEPEVMILPDAPNSFRSSRASRFPRTR